MTALAAIALAAGSAPPLIETTSHVESASSAQSVHELVVQAQPSAVWQAVSTSQGWSTWAAANAWTLPGEPDVIESSYDPKARPGAPGNIRSRIIVSVPERLLAFRTIKAPQGFADADALTAVTWVIELEPVPDRATRVRLIGSGFPLTSAGKRIQDFFLSHNPIALRSLNNRLTAPGNSDRAK